MIFKEPERVALAGLYSAIRITKSKLKDQRILFMGAGEAGIGIGNVFVPAIMAEGLTEEQARGRCWYFDVNGLIVRSRKDLTEHQLSYAHDHEPLSDFISAVELLRPTVIIGVSAQPKAFSRQVLETMLDLIKSLSYLPYQIQHQRQNVLLKKPIFGRRDGQFLPAVARFSR